MEEVRLNDRGITSASFLRSSQVVFYNTSHYHVYETIDMMDLFSTQKLITLSRIHSPVKASELASHHELLSLLQYTPDGNPSRSTRFTAVPTCAAVDPTLVTCISARTILAPLFYPLHQHHHPPSRPYRYRNLFSVYSQYR